MDPILTLAILSLGAFIGVLVVSLFYALTLRRNWEDQNVLPREPQVFYPARPRAEISVRPVGVTRSGGGSIQSTDLQEMQQSLDEMVMLLQKQQTTPANPEMLQLTKDIQQRIVAQRSLLDSLDARLHDELAAQDETLDTIVHQLDMQTSIIANANAILEDMDTSGALASLAGRFADVGEQVDTIASNLMQQDNLLQRIHSQVVPERASETLYTMMAMQGAQLNGLASQLQYLDEQLGSVDPSKNPQAVANLENQIEEYRDKVNSLAYQIKSQENLLGEGGGEEAMPLSQRESLDQQLSDYLQEARQASSDQRALLEKITAQLQDVDTDVETIKRSRRRPSRLTDIRGVGPVYAGLLYEAGIENVKQLSVLTAEELRGLVNVPSWKRINAEGWIQQAQVLAARDEKLEANP